MYSRLGGEDNGGARLEHQPARARASVSLERPVDTNPEPCGGAETPDDAEDGRDDGDHDGSSNDEFLAPPDENDQSYKGADASEHEHEIEGVVDCLITF